MIGALLGGWHLVWSILVVLHRAQPILDFIFWAHMIKPVYVVAPFDFIAAFTLVAITTATGYVFGLAGAFAWNKLNRQ